MHDSALFLITTGSLLLIGIFASALAKRTFLPRVTLLLIFGAIIGLPGYQLIPQNFSDHFPLVADVTLLMVGFILGGKLTKDSFIASANQVIWISLCAAIFTSFIVTLGLWLLGMSFSTAIILGCIASATAPAAIMDVINELNIDTKFSRLLLSIVTLDDIWALMLFAIGMAIATSSAETNVAANNSILFTSLIEIGGSIALGIVLGIPAAYITGRITEGQPSLTEAIAVIFVCGGLAMWLELSYLITAITVGAVIANIAKHHDYAFHEIENIEAPFMVVFFILAGASLELMSLLEIGLMGFAFIVLRTLGKYLGARIGGVASGANQLTTEWIGPALLPQAGVAIGMALVASHHFEEDGHILLTIAIGSTIVFELIGPVITHIAIKRVGNQSR